MRKPRKTRLLWMYFENKTNLYTTELKVLHIAPETVFFHLFKKQKNINYHPGDIFPHMYPNGTTYFDLLNHDLPEQLFRCYHLQPCISIY